VSLNEQQNAAVAHRDGPLLVLAGAGTGKTRVLVHRIAQLVHLGDEPWSILAVTFTNKAAGEMKARLRALLGARVEPMWIGTFHAVCARLLRRHGERVGLSRSFAIFDDDDQMKLVSRLLKDHGYEDQISPRTLLGRFDRAKNRGVDPTTEQTGQLSDELVAAIYPRYQAQLAKENAVDFNDILLFALRLAEDPEVGPRLATMFRHVLVDEFQDTNRVQFDLVTRLASATRNLTVVGDDDQSIYGWRGAEPRNLLDFQQAFPDATLIRLEQNYRSTQVVLDAANAVITHNDDRLGKSLWTERGRGDLIDLIQAGDERTEAYQVAQAIRRLLGEGAYSPRDFAVLYRTNAQSRVLEEHLRAFQIPAQVVGAQSFFERKEIKDVIAYLRLVANEAADSAFERVVNVPSRGIGDTSVERLRAAGRASGLGLLAAARLAARGEVSEVPAAARRRVSAFVQVIDGLASVANAGASLAELVIQTIDRSAMRSRLEADGSQESLDRVANLAEFVTLASDFDEETEGKGTLVDFLERIVLSTAVDEQKDGNLVTLMTIHIAKGLEFPVVFLSGMEDGLFPSLRERDGHSERQALEEERRLAYVAMTRAKDRLIMTLARTRRVWGEIRIQTPSRFLDEIPRECWSVSPRARGWGAAPPPSVAAPARPRAPRKVWDEFDQRSGHADDPVFDLDADLASAGDPWNAGARVSHAAFGTGRVVQELGSGKDHKLVVDFASVGRKTVLSRFLARM
jgi:DNA helicase-2/ATP-dependent DNA helicase PcrA